MAMTSVSALVSLSIDFSMSAISPRNRSRDIILGQFDRLLQHVSARQPGRDGGGVDAAGAVQAPVLDARGREHPFSLGGPKEIHRFVGSRQVPALDQRGATEALTN